MLVAVDQKKIFPATAEGNIILVKNMHFIHERICPWIGVQRAFVTGISGIWHQSECIHHDSCVVIYIFY